MFAKNGNGWRIGRMLRVAALAAAAFCLTPDVSAAAKPDGTYTETVDGIEWTYVVSGGEASVLEIPFNTKGAVTIPSTLGGVPVTSIGEEAFVYCYELTSVTIPSSVTSIGEWAFAECYGLTSVTILEGVTSIGAYAFYNCDGLTEIVVAEGNAAYCSVDGMLLTKDKGELICCPAGKTGAVTIPEGVTSIGASAFAYCDGLTAVTIPSGVTSIGDYAFGWCSRLTSVTIPSSVMSIGEGAFGECSGLMSVTIPSGVTSIGDYAFYDCSGLMSVTIPSSVTSIGEAAFLGCFNLATVYVAQGDVDRVKGLCSWLSWVAFVEIERAVVPADVTGGKELVVEATWVTDELVARFGAGKDKLFAEKFGDDLSAALLKPSGKTAADGSPMCVWQDYVAGTDPTDPNSKFTVEKAEIVDGDIKVTWKPNLNEGGRSVRKYIELGRETLGGGEGWTDLTGMDAERRKLYPFRKVKVEMP